MPIHLLPPWCRPCCSARRCFQQLIEAAHGFDHLLLFFGEVFFRELLEPFRRNLDGRRIREKIETLEHMAEDAIELVEVALVLN